MAEATDVKNYLGHWFQLGKGIVFPKSQEVVRPVPIFEGQYFSRAFEACWQRILTTPEDAYLEGTEQSLHELLTPAWEILDCARCAMPVPFCPTRIPTCLCPCVDLECWPNRDLPQPRLPENRIRALHHIQTRLLTQLDQDDATEGCLLPRPSQSHLPPCHSPITRNG